MPYCASIYICAFLLFTTTPEPGENVVLPIPISINWYCDPTGIATEEFDGIVKLVAEGMLRIIVLLTSSASKVKADVFVTIVLIFAIRGSTSNLNSTAFQSSPVPARSGYPPAEVCIAFVTYEVVAKRDVSSIP